MFTRQRFSCLSFIFSLIAAFSVNAAEFSIQGTKIMHPDGYEFKPVGTNVVGWNYYDWSNNTVSYASTIQNGWKFNIVRANILLKQGLWNGQLFGTTWKGHETECQIALDAIINTYTAKGIVVMLEVHDWTGTYPYDADLTLLCDFYRWAANRYKNNTYVWFNIMNEPQWNSSNPVADPYWATMHQKVISTIRDTVTSNNIIVCDGVQTGQEAYSWDNNPVYAGNSAILTYGTSVKQFNNKTYPNIMFSFHCYSVWGYNNQQFDAKMIDFIDRIHAKGLAVMVGEVGARSLTDIDNVQTTGTVYRVCVPRNVGFLQWHYEAADGFSLLTPSNNGNAINSLTNPTNLNSWCGTYFWKVVHVDGWGLQPQVLADPSITTQPQGVSVVVGASAQFSVVASGTTPISYQWYRNGTAISGAASSAYSITSTVSSDNGAIFRVTVTNSSGSVTSTNATLTVSIATTNLVVNPGFESGVINWADWGNSVIATTNAHSGTNSLQVGVSAGGRGNTMAGMLSSTTYILSGWGKFDRSTSDVATIGVKGADVAGTTFDYPIFFTDAAYTQKSFTFTTPTNLSWIQVYVWKNAGSAYFYADDISINQYTVTNIPPTVAITSPLNGAVFTAPASFTITANANDGDGSISKVEFFDNGTKLGEDLSSPYSWSMSSVASGTHPLTAKATDNAGAITSSALVSVTVGSSTTVNIAPVVNAGIDLSVNLPNKAALNGTVTDDGLPSSTLTYKWTVTSSPRKSSVVFGTPAAPATTAGFSKIGNYILRLTASDGQYSAYDDIAVTVLSATANVAPTATVMVSGSGLAKSNGNTPAVILNALVKDDGFPFGDLEQSWHFVDGPEVIRFANPELIATDAVFPKPGNYTVGFTVNDFDLTSTTLVAFTVSAGGQVGIVKRNILEGKVNIKDRLTVFNLQGKRVDLSNTRNFTNGVYLLVDPHQGEMGSIQKWVKIKGNNGL
ncbi:MAG: cellulase family glycosylhydrolase [Fibrobacterota bacterium]|nr:cellulase family glycosylhydrolase [Fibrobacterota bacterium]